MIKRHQKRNPRRRNQNVTIRYKNSDSTSDKITQMMLLHLRKRTYNDCHFFMQRAFLTLVDPVDANPVEMTKVEANAFCWHDPSCHNYRKEENILIYWEKYHPLDQWLPFLQADNVPSTLVHPVDANPVEVTDLAAKVFCWHEPSCDNKEVSTCLIKCTQFIK